MAKQQMEDLIGAADEIAEKVDALFRLDDESRSELWSTYCGEFDPMVEGDRENATAVGQRLQEAEQEELDEVESMTKSLIAEIEELQEDEEIDAELKAESAELLEGLGKIEANLNKMHYGVVLTGSNHPFVQTCIEYGQRMHDEYGKSAGGNMKIYNQQFDQVDGKPDLVTIESGKFVIYEFKPNNSRAESKGKKQLERYGPVVVAYFEEFFEDGCNKGFTGKEPRDEHGGQAFLDELMNTRDAWSSDGSRIEPVLQILTYSMCEKNIFDEE